MPPGPRASFSMCVHKKRAVLFGGVVDVEGEGNFLFVFSRHFDLTLYRARAGSLYELF